MIKPFQRKLVDAATAKLDLGADGLAHALRKFGQVNAVEDLSQHGYDRVMDYFTVIGFRDRRRPIATLHTCRIIREVMTRIFTEAQITTLESVRGSQERTLRGGGRLHTRLA